jgi:hypothetical protein
MAITQVAAVEVDAELVAQPVVIETLVDVWSGWEGKRLSSKCIQNLCNRTLKTEDL